MINWRSGKAGFVGGSKYIVKGVFKYFHSVTSVTAAPPETPPSEDYNIDFLVEDRNVVFALESRTIAFPQESRGIDI